MPGVTGEAAAGKTALQCRWQIEVGDYVTDAALSHDGALAAVATGGGTVVVVEAATGRARWRALAHDGGALTLAFSPREAILATGGQDGSARLFGAEGNRLAELPGKGAWTEHVAWSPDGRLLATAMGRVLRLWTSSGQPFLETESHASTIAGIAWHRKSREVATCCYGGVQLWPLETGAQAKQLPWKGSLLSIAWSPDGRVIACGSQELSVHFWRLSSGNDSQMSGYPFKPRALAWDSGSTMLATAGDAKITIWAFVGKGPEGKPPQELEGHKAQCTALAFAPKSGRLASGGQDTGLLLWEPHRGSKPVRHAFLEDEITKVVWDADGKAFLASDASGCVGLFRVE